MRSGAGESVLRWGVPRTLPAAKFGGAAGFVLLGVLLADGDPVRLWLAGLAALGLAGWGLRDLVAPVRLTADSGGVTVATGLAGSRRFGWAEIERIGVDTRPRLGLRTETLEIDTGETLHLFGRADLGAAPDEVARHLRSLHGGPAAAN
ncbi:PH domain-containing protein [Micromonospora zhanjiangensis]|uniref:PH domain-containing protein n=1 Tax=Micromonospora zhanjiangensis TaxID=1522057 RepID=A0ABV8KKU9_9ACTN